MKRTIRALCRTGLLLAAFALNGPRAHAQCDYTGNPYGTVTAPALNATATVGCNYAGEYNTMNGATIGTMYRVSSTVATDYITIRATTPDGAVVAAGVGPLVFQATDVTLYGHISVDATCATQGSCRDITYLNLGVPCNNASQYGSATAGAVGTVVTIANDSYAGEYSIVSGITPGTAYKFASSVSTDWITVHITTSSGPVIGFGQTPLTVVAPAGATTLYPHWNTDQSCGIQSSNRVTTVENLGVPGACPVPAGVNVSGLTTTDATLNWTANGSVSYNWEIRSSGAPGSGATGLVASGNAASGPVTTSALAANTPYTAYVQSVCSGPSTSSWTIGTAFTTPCAAVNVPWSDSFESNTIDFTGTGLQVVPCFSIQNLVGSATGNWRQRVTPIRNGIGARTGTDYMTATWSTDGWLFSPPINLNAGQSYDFTYWYTHTDANPNWVIQLQAAVGTTNNGASMTSLGSPVNANTNVYQPSTNTFVAPAAGVYYFGVRHTETTGAPWYTNTDDWSVIETPACQSPTAVIASNLSFTSADISWTAPSPAPSVGYEWEVRSSGAAGSGAVGLAASGATATTSASTGATLTANTTYFAYVRSDCGAGSYSPWSFAGQFFTGYCTPSTSNTGYYISDFSTSGGILNIANAASGLSAGGYGDFTALTVGQVAGGVVNFSATMVNSTYGFNIWVDWNNNLSFNDPGETVYQPLTYTGLATGSFTVPVAQALGNYRMRIRADLFTSNPAACGSIFYGEAEDYTLQVITPPTCFPPTGLTATGVTLTDANFSWTAAVPAPFVGYDWELRTSGSGGSGPAGLALSGSTAGTTANAGNALAPATTYSLYVRSDCGAGDLSAWAGPYTFPTLTPGQIGTGTATNTNLPIYSCYGYNYSQQIYLASEYNTPANSMITAIRFYYDGGGTTVSNWQDWVVYMANTTKTDFTSSSDWVPSASLTQVFSGTVTPVAGNWMEITLSSPFVWDGTSNILVAVDENTPNYSCTAAWRSYTASGNRGIEFYSDGTNPDPTAPPTANYGPTNNLAQIQLVGQAPVPCTAPTPGNTLANVTTICAGQNFTLSLQNQTSGTGVSYQWQSSPDNIAPYTDITGAMSNSYVATMATTAWYRCNVTCATGPTTVASAPVQVLQTPGINCYCTPTTTYGCTDGDVIARVTLNTLDNNSGTGCPSGTLGYSDYTSTPASPPNTYTTTLQAGSSYSCTVYAGQYAEGYAAWVDYNDDGFFAPSERIGYSIGTVAGSGQVGVLGSSASFPIILACNPPLGAHRLRVRAMYATNGVAVDPCVSNFYGETEDYTVTITQADPCPAPYNQTVSAVTTSGATLGWTLGCAETAWDLQLQPVGGPAPSGSGNNPGLTSTSFNATGLIPGQLYEFYVRANCGGGNGESAWVGPKVFGPTPVNDVCANTVPLALTAGSSVSNLGHTYGAVNNDNLFGYAAVWEAVTVTTCIQSLTVSMCGTNPVHPFYWGPLYSDCNGTQVFANGTSNTTACVDGNLTIAYGSVPPGTYYFPIVYAPGQIEQGPYQITWTAGASCPIPACATNMSPATGGLACSGGTTTFSWSAVPFASSYEVFVDGLSVGTTAATTFAYPGLTPGAHTWSVVPSNSTGTATGCPTNNIDASFVGCYCASGATNAADEEIYSVSFNGVSHGGDAADCGVAAPGSGSIAGRYANYRTLGSLWSFTQGIPTPFSVTEDECDGAPYYGFGTAVWIDFNQDGTFDDVTEKVFVEGSTASGPRVVSGTMDIPFAALPGVTGMRITVAEGISGTSLTSCLSYGYGETHDYLVTIVAGNNNYTCEDAVPLTCFDIKLAYLTGTSSLPPTACAFNGAPSTGGTTWWTYTATSSDDVRFKVTTDPSFDVRLSAFRATASPDCSNLVCIGGVDNSTGFGGGGELKVKCSPGDLIYLAVHGVTGISGVISVETDCTAPCAVPATNDLCAGATNMVLGYTPVTITDDNTCAYVDAPTQMSGTSPVQGLWYTFNSGVNSLIRMYLGTPGSATGLRYALYTGGCAGLGAATEVSNGFAGGFTNLAVTPSTQYHLLVYNGGGNGVEGSYTLSLEAPPIVDAAITAIQAPVATICGTQFQPQVELKNLGETTLTNATITVSIDGGATILSYPWTGSLAFQGDVIVTLPTVNTPTGPHTLNVTVTVPGDQRTSNDQLNGGYSADGQQITVRLTTDANPGQTTWTIFGPAPTFQTYVQGGPYILPNNLEVSTHCLPNGGRYFFTLSDAGSDGINTGNSGAWELRDRFNNTILQDDGTFSSISPNNPPLTAGYPSHEVNLPLGPAAPWTAAPYEVCRNYNLGVQSKIRCTAVSGVTTYQWEFLNPNQGYRRRATATTNYLTWANMASQAPVLGVRYFVRNRVDQGAAGLNDDNWGPGCEMAWSNTGSFCTNLITTPGSTFSCGVSRTWGGSSKVWAQPVVGAAPFDGNGDGDVLDAVDQKFVYHFRITRPGYVKDVWTTSYVLQLNWTTLPMTPGTYTVQVEAQVGGVWRGFCSTTTCTVTITGTPAVQGGGRVDATSAIEDLQLWPNPVRDGRVTLRIEGISDTDQRITVDVYDAFGKRVVSEQYANSGDLFNTALDLGSETAAGLYMVHVNINGRTYVKHLSVL